MMYRGYWEKVTGCLADPISSINLAPQTAMSWLYDVGLVILEIQYKLY